MSFCANQRYATSTVVCSSNTVVCSCGVWVWPSQRWCLFQSGVCGCEKGYTEVMTTHGFLDYCTKTPGADNKKADVKTSSGRLKPGTTQIQDFFGEWSLQPLGPGIWNADEDQADVGQRSVALSYSRIAGRVYETPDRGWCRTLFNASVFIPYWSYEKSCTGQSLITAWFVLPITWQTELLYCWLEAISD